MKKFITLVSVLSLSLMSSLTAQNRQQQIKPKSVMEAKRVESVYKKNSVITADVEETVAVVSPVAMTEDLPIDCKAFTNETQFRLAYDKLMNEYLQEYGRSNKAWVEGNSAIDTAYALGLEQIQNKRFSECWSETEIDFKKEDLREALQKKVAESREVMLNKLQNDYNNNIAKIDAKKTELDSALMSSDFVITDVDVIFSPYDSISKSWLFKVTSFDPEVKFSTDWMKLALDYESLEAQYENIAPRIKAGVRAVAHYSIYVYNASEPEDYTSYERVVTQIELFDRSGKSIAVFDELSISAGMWDWAGYRRKVFANPVAEN